MSVFQGAVSVRVETLVRSMIIDRKALQDSVAVTTLSGRAQSTDPVIAFARNVRFRSHKIACRQIVGP